jgi:hypothetical protein
MSLLEELSKLNSDLKRYNSQIATRMQERDEDLAQAYAEINALENVRLRLIIACVILACLLTLVIVLRIMRFI